MNGEGTKQNPYTITGLEELNKIRNDLTACYKIINDIKIPRGKNEYFTPIGSHQNKFTGVLDGSGYSIKGLTIEKEGTHNIGLFSRIGEAGKVTDITLSKVDIQGSVYTGSLTGFNEGTITQCSVTGTVEGSEVVGGIAGRNYNSINKSGFIGEAFCNESIGGIGGFNTGCLENVFFIGSLHSEMDAKGGLCGYNGNKINKSWCATQENIELAYDIKDGVIKNSNSFLLRTDESNNIRNIDLRIELGGTVIEYDATSHLLASRYGNNHITKLTPREACVLTQVHNNNIEKITEDFKTQAVTYML